MKSKIVLFLAVIMLTMFSSSMAMAETDVPSCPATERLSEETLRILPEPLKTMAANGGGEWQGDGQGALPLYQ
jgi:predicted S18 family serine protease